MFFQQSAWYDGALHFFDNGNFFDILSRKRVFVVIPSPPYVYNAINTHVYCRAKLKPYFQHFFHKNDGILFFGKFPNAIQPNTLNWPRSLFKKWPLSIKCNGLCSIGEFVKKTKNKCLEFVRNAKFFHFQTFLPRVPKFCQNWTCLKRSINIICYGEKIKLWRLFLFWQKNVKTTLFFDLRPQNRHFPKNVPKKLLASNTAQNSGAKIEFLKGLPFGFLPKMACFQKHPMLTNTK